MAMRYVFLVSLLSLKVYAQQGGGLPYDGILTNNNYTETQLVNDIFLKGGCAGVENIQAIGNAKGIGYFENAEHILGMKRGIILSTGSVSTAMGPNEVPDAQGDFNDKTGDEDLEQLSDTRVYDVVGLSFEFVPVEKYVTFRYVFASEEYCEYVNSQYNDVFGFFVSGPGLDGEFKDDAINAAVLANTEDYVSINNINHLKNENFYVSNHLAGDDSRCGILFTPKPLWGYIEYDGFTTVLNTVIRVVPCERYKIKLVVADVGDHLFDSAVFLEAKSFSLGGEVEISVEAPIRNKAVQEGCGDAYFIFERTNPDRLINEMVLPVKISQSSTAIEGVDYEALPDSIIIPAGVSKYKLPVVTYDNPNQSADRKIILELNYGCNCLKTGAELVITELEPFEAFPVDTMICRNVFTEIDIGLKGGSPPFTYSYQGQTSAFQLGITTDRDTAFQVRIDDNCGQSDSVFVQLTAIESPSAQLVGGGITCEGDSLPYELLLQGSPPFYFHQYVNGIPGDSFFNINSRVFSFQSKEEGIYTIEEFGDQICPGVVTGAVVHQVAQIDLGTSIVEPACSAGSNGAIALQPTGGTAPYLFNWEDGFQGSQRMALPAGQYAVTVEDVNGCLVQETIGLYNYSAIQASFEPCLSQDLPITLSGGFPPYLFSLDHQNFQDENIFQQFNPGDSIFLTIADQNDCRATFKFRMPFQNQSFSNTLGDFTIDIGKSLNLAPQYFIPNQLIDSFSWTPAEQFSCTNCPASNFIGVNTTDYQLTVFDIFGCQQMLEGTITVVPNATFFIPDAFSPNGDAINDNWVFFVDQRQVKTLLEVAVFDRWGNRVHYAEQISGGSDLNIWDGGVQLPGLYLYTATLELVNGDSLKIFGSVHLVK